MAVDNPKVIDVISVDESTDSVILDIADHLDWSQEHRHLMMLEAKINAYIQFIQSGQLFEAYPDAHGRTPVIHVGCYHSPSVAAVSFFSEVARLLGSDGIGLTYKHSHFNSPPEAI